MKNNRKTKIVATLGPSSSSVEMISSLIQSGLNVARFNFSHGTPEAHSKVLGILREESARQNQPVAVLQDLSGPKLRIGPVSGDRLEIAVGSSIRLAHKDSTAARGEADKSDVALPTITVDCFHPEQIIVPGAKILLADGRIELVARNVFKSHVEAEALSGGVIRSFVGINLPESGVDLPAITAKDLRDLDWGIANQVDYVAVSYVSSANDIVKLKKAIVERGGDCKVIAKIERKASLDSISEILEEADGVMVARGDLGLEIPLELVPRAQRLIINAARAVGKPVITATQMLLSLVAETRPTRAEVSDIYAAVMQGTDAVMLSEETAMGKHPVRAVQIMDRVLLQAEEDLDWRTPAPWDMGRVAKPVEAIAFATEQAADRLNAAAIVVLTESGKSAQLLSHYRPNASIQVLGASRKIQTCLALFWGVHTLSLPSELLSTEVPGDLADLLTSVGYPPESIVVVMRGQNKTKAVATMEVYRL